MAEDAAKVEARQQAVQMKSVAKQKAAEEVKELAAAKQARIIAHRVNKKAKVDKRQAARKEAKACASAKKQCCQEMLLPSTVPNCKIPEQEPQEHQNIKANSSSPSDTWHSFPSKIQGNQRLQANKQEPSLLSN